MNGNSLRDTCKIQAPLYYHSDLYVMFARSLCISSNSIHSNIRTFQRIPRNADCSSSSARLLCLSFCRKSRKPHLRNNSFSLVLSVFFFSSCTFVQCSFNHCRARNKSPRFLRSRSKQTLSRGRLFWHRARKSEAFDCWRRGAYRIFAPLT